MSLTRAEWCRMWESIKKIEYEIQLPMWKKRRREILQETERIKEQIQSVIGQME
jgi:hypothetical protein